MTEQAPQSNGQEMQSIRPENVRIPAPVELTPEENEELVDMLKRAKEAEDTGNTQEAYGLYLKYKEMYNAIRKQRQIEKRGEQGEIGETILQRNQAMYDFLDLRDPLTGEVINLQKEYEEGNIQGLSKEQLKTIEEMPEEERFTEILIIPGGISREEIIKKINDKYKEKFGKDIFYSDEAKADLDKTSATKENPRPNTFYTIALNPKQETVDAHPEMANKTLQEQLDELKRKQEENPNLNLRGLTLSEALLFDALVCANSKNQDDHSDNLKRKWSYNRLLEEVTRDKDGNPLRALGLDWFSDFSRLELFSYSFSISDIGARLGAVSA